MMHHQRVKNVGGFPKCLSAMALVCVASASIAPMARADSAVAWGAGFSGQLGDGSNGTSSLPVDVTGLSTGVTAVAAGESHTVAIQNGAVKAWGNGSLGQIGTNASASNTPIDIPGLSSGVTAIASGVRHNLVIQNGAVKAWGFGGLGELGTTSGFTTGQVVDTEGLSSGVSAIACGGYHSLAIQNGGVKAWGYNQNGQLGNGTNTFGLFEPPVDVTGLSSGVTAIAGGTFFSLAVQNGGLKAWGQGGALGDGTSLDSATPVDVVGLSSGVTKIAAGDHHALAIKDGDLYAWGDSLGLDLGAVNYLVPQKALDLSIDLVDVAAGQNGSSYALSSDGSIWVFGNNQFGQLGLGNNTSFPSSPVQMFAPVGYEFTSIESSSMSLHAVATIGPIIPEPTSLTLLAGVSLLAMRRRR